MYDFRFKRAPPVRTGSGSKRPYKCDTRRIRLPRNPSPPHACFFPPPKTSKSLSRPSGLRTGKASRFEKFRFPNTRRRVEKALVLHIKNALQTNSETSKPLDVPTEMYTFVYTFTYVCLDLYMFTRVGDASKLKVTFFAKLSSERRARDLLRNRHPGHLRVPIGRILHF